jgi:2-polyprenyl-3-methyl-5-hydroxy-6-metoxy-1,4-benzoquinol methylase
MPDFTKRSYQKELLDRDDVPFEDIKRNMQELETVNKYLGGHRITVKSISPFLYQHKAPLVICEIGCGGGDNLKVISKWFAAKKTDIKLIGIDINKECIAYAKQTCKDLNAEWIISDYRLANLSPKPDVIFSSLFCHHFTDEELVIQLQWMRENATAGFFINDLHRHPVAYYSIKWLTKIFSKSYLVKNDAPLSVLRGFTKKEWQRVLRAARLDNYSLKWKWAFRWVIAYQN